MNQIVLNDESGRRMNVPLSDLLLDVKNPRFGGLGRVNPTQAEVLDHIVDAFGVDDLLSSLSINGYFDAEPLVVREEEGKLIVAEGNRRLAACLMLSDDERALRQRDKAKSHIEAWDAHGRPPIDRPPVILFSEEAERKGLLSYLGVRHISAAKSWDSYAKAAWVADVVETHRLSVSDIAKMIGDQHNTIDRLLQGYYVVKQLEESGQFIPTNSQKGGRGSVTAYPFSWVYTILGYTAAKEYLELADAETKEKPIQEKNLRKGAVLMTAMFGDKSRGRSSAVKDSRQLGRLAAMLADPETLTMLEQGKSVDDIESATQKIEDKLRVGIHQVREILRDLVARMDESPVGQDVAIAMIGPTEKATAVSASLVRKLKEIAIGQVADIGGNFE